jgi:hypothetical protein
LKCIIFSIDRFLKNQRVFNVFWGLGLYYRYFSI